MTLRWTSETEGMKLMKCCLTIDPSQCLQAACRDLDPGSVVVQADKAFPNAKDNTVQFPGGTAYFLRDAASSAHTAIAHFPTTFVVYGEVFLNAADVDHLRVQFRDGNARYIWPNHEAVLQCPCCCKSAEVSPDGRYVLALQLICQIADAKIAQQIFPRLFCSSCFQRLTDGLTVTDANMANPRPIPIYPDVVSRAAGGPPLQSVYTLLSAKYEAGFFNALSLDLGQYMMAMLGSKVSKSGSAASGLPSSRPIVPGTLICGLPPCKLFSNPNTGFKLKLCGGCKKVKYCSAEHQREHWDEHKHVCKK